MLVEYTVHHLEAYGTMHEIHNIISINTIYSDGNTPYSELRNSEHTQEEASMVHHPSN